MTCESISALASQLALRLHAYAMAFARSNTSKTLDSQAWSSTALLKGVSHVLLEGKDELPDDIAALEDFVWKKEVTSVTLDRAVPQALRS